MARTGWSGWLKSNTAFMYDFVRIHATHLRRFSSNDWQIYGFAIAAARGLFAAYAGKRKVFAERVGWCRHIGQATQHRAKP
jgi:hypothetical protein